MRTTLVALFAALAMACSVTPNDPSSSGPAPQTGNGQTGSPSYQCTAADCGAIAEQTRSSLAQSQSPPTFVAASCHPPSMGAAELDTRSTVFCRCDQSDGGFMLISDVSLGPGCEVRGRGGFCIFDDSDFSGCDVADPRSCDGTCSTLQARLVADAAKSLSAEVRFSGCVAPPPGSPLGTLPHCGIVLQVGDQCFTNDPGGATLGQDPVDCALSDAEILSPWLSAVPDGGAAGAGSAASPEP